MNSHLEVLLTHYKPSEEAIHLVSKVKTLFLVGISGAGKDTMQKVLLESGDYHQIVSHTTRKLRKNRGILEKDGIEYYFISLEKAAKMLENHEFVEAKYYSGNIYGTSVEEFKKAQGENKIAICDIEIQGVVEYKSIVPDSMHPVFLLPPSYEIWQQRWQKRWGEESDRESKKIRMQTAIAEIEHVLKTDYYSIVVNDDVAETAKHIDTIAKTGVQDDESYTVGRNTAEKILEAMKMQISTL